MSTLKPVDTAAALGSGSAPLPSLPQPWARVLPLVLGSAASPFEATRQPSKGRPETEDVPPNLPTGTLTLSQRFAFSLVRWVGVARCEAICRWLRMHDLVQSLGKLISDFELTSERRQNLVFKSSPSVVS